MDINKIKNLIVRRALQGRVRDFMFNYGDDSGNKSSHRDWSEYGDYSERYTHNDDTSGSKIKRHSDHTETYKDYGDYDVYSEHSEAIGHCDGSDLDR